MRKRIIAAVVLTSVVAACATAPAGHGGMSHEEMMRHCAEMRAGEAAPQR